MAQVDPQALWAKIKSEAVAKLEFNVVLADALNAVVPVLIDGDTLVLGMPEGTMHHSGILKVPDKKNLISSVLRSETGGAVTNHEFIEGTTPKDWEFVKARQARASAHTEAAMASRKAQAGAVTTIDELIQELHRRYQTLEGRGFPQIKAKWVMDLIPTLVSVEEKLRGSDEQWYRNYARVIEKVASLTDIPAVVIALEIEHHKRATGGG